MGKTLAERIRESTPKEVNDSLILRNKRLKYHSKETIRKYGLSIYWGYSYPDYRLTGNPKAHYRNCINSLNSMEIQLSELFSGFQIQTDERAETPVGKLWTEDSTMPLFEEVYKKGLLAYLISPFKTLAGNLLKSIKKEHEEFCSDMVSLSGMTGDYNPKIERLLVLTSERGEEINLSVSPNRHFRRYFGGFSIEVCDKGSRILGYQSLPLLLQLKGFDSVNTQFRELHERLVQMDFSPIKKEFPFIPNQTENFHWYI